MIINFEISEIGVWENARKEDNVGDNILKGDQFIKMQPVKLTPEEITEHGDALAKSNIDLAQTELDVANVKKQYASKIAGFEASIQSHSMFITTKEEWRDVECQWLFNFSRGTKDLVRLDTGQIIESKIKVTDHDRQRMLPLPKTKKDNKA